MRALLATLIALSAGCRERRVTYREVAPILARHCHGCHRPGGVAAVPAFDDYASARRYAQPIRFAVQTRRMPPWGADDTGLCNTWQGARWLAPDEIATLAAWQEGGAPEGPPLARAPAPPDDTAASAPFRADAALAGPQYQPGLGPGGNRCFVADPALDRDRLLTAIRVVAADPRGVAQLTLFALDSAVADAQAAALDAADAAPGYPCFGTARVDAARLVASWSWPAPVLRLPAGTGVRLRAARKVIVQIHYDITLAGGGFATATRVDLELDDGAREARVWPVRAAGALAPGERWVSVESRTAVTEPLRVVGVAPRMHIRGQTLQLTVERGARSSCLGTFDHWHFNDQQLFRPERPPALEPGDTIHLSCAYNTLGRAAPVTFGDDIDDEECSAYLLVTAR